jgi:hypothetical protein
MVYVLIERLWTQTMQKLLDGTDTGEGLVKK